MSIDIKVLVKIQKGGTYRARPAEQLRTAFVVVVVSTFVASVALLFSPMYLKDVQNSELAEVLHTLRETRRAAAFYGNHMRSRLLV
jgi:hypothetical protein